MRALPLIRMMLWLALAGTSSGCVGDLLQSKVDEPATFVLSPQSVAVASVAYDAELAVAQPEALPALNTARIALLRNGNRIEYVYGARWSGTAPQVIQSFMVSLLRSRQGLRSVAAEGARVDADLLLQLELRDFQAEYTQSTAPQAHITLVATLVNIRTRRALATFEQSAVVPAADNRQGAIVAAFQSAAQKVGVALSDQITAQLSKQPAGS